MSQISVEDLWKKFEKYDLVILEVEPNKFQTIKYKVGLYQCRLYEHYKRLVSREEAEWEARWAIEQDRDPVYKVVIYYYDQYKKENLQDFLDTIDMLYKMCPEKIGEELGIAYGETAEMLKENEEWDRASLSSMDWNDEWTWPSDE